MRMRLLDRVLLTFYTLIIIVVSLTLLFLSISAAFGIISSNSIKGYLSSFQYDWKFITVSFIVSVIFLVISTKLLFSGMTRKRPQSTLLKNTELGAVQISVDTLAALTQKAVKSFDKIKDVKTMIVTEMDGIKIKLIILILPDTIIPELTQSVQIKVKEYIESLSGVIVKEVQIYVDNLSTPQRQRVE